MAGTLFAPTSGHINQALTNLVVQYPSRFRFIADEIANVVPVEKESDAFWTIDSMSLVDHSTRVKKAPGGESNAIEVTWAQDSYQTEEYALHDVLPHRTRDNADNVLGLETACAGAARDGVLLAKEIRAAAVFFSTTYMTNTGATAARWDDSTAANIKIWNDVLGAKRQVRKFGSAAPTHIAMGDVTWTSVAKYIMAQAGTSAGVRWNEVARLLAESPDDIPSMFLGLKLLVGNAVKSSALSPANVSRASSGGNISDVWADQCLVFHKGNSGVKSVQLAARFMKSGWPRIRQGTFADTRASDWYEYAENEVLKVIAAPLAYLLTNTET